MPRDTLTQEFTHFHFCCGIGGGAKGFNKANPRVGAMSARFRCLGGVDVSPAAIRDFNRIAGVPGTVMDLFSRGQYVAFHGKEPPAVWREMGPAPASFPLFGRALFAGIEHVSGIARAEEDIAHLAQTPHTRIGADWISIAKVVIGWAGPSDCSIITGDARMREVFLQYLDTVRVKPADLELHTNTWWSLPLPFAEGDVLKHIDALRRGFYDRTISALGVPAFGVAFAEQEVASLPVEAHDMALSGILTENGLKRFA